MSKFGEIFDRGKNKDSKYKRTPHRILVKDGIYSEGEHSLGRITSIVGANYLVKALGDDSPKQLECTPAGTIKSKHGEATLLAVGDFVNYISDANNQDNLGKIIAVLERETWLSRKPLIGIREDIIAVNSTYLLIVMAADSPKFNKRLIDRLIVSAKIGNLTPFICINKMDLADRDSVLKDLSAYNKLGYEIFLTSIINQSGIEELNAFINGKEIIFIGPSGVGKSSILNELAGYKIQKIMEVSEKTSKGKHATSSARLVELDNETVIIDTPGIREFGIVNIKKEELTLYFEDFADYYNNCRFMPCSHTHEPDCAVKEAVYNNLIDIERYESYLNIYSSIQNI